MMKRLAMRLPVVVVFFLIWVSLVTFTECLVFRSRRLRWTASSTARFQVRQEQFNTRNFSSSCRTVLGARDNKEEEGASNTQPIAYNDDAFGLVFLSSIFVAQDYTFAACFGLLSMLSAGLVQFQVTKFTPLIPGMVALVSYAVSRIIVGVPDEAVPVELATCAVSLAWGLSKQRGENDK